ncbi:MAG: hypothetical protein RL683_522 [Actinomycetota bacterium]|jgi:hypothetical protein
MTNNADYELWAAMQADDEEPLTAPVATPTAPVVIPEPEPAVIDIPETYVVPQPEEVEEVVDIAIQEDPYEFSDLAHSVIDETEEFPNQLFKEPQTNQITMPVIPDALNTEIVTESGDILKTGAIDIPLGTNTGSIEIITGTLETVDEEAIALDMGSETTGGIPPIRAKAVMNSSAKVGVLPIKNRRSEGQVIILATTSLLLITLGALVIAAYWFKLIN